MPKKKKAKQMKWGSYKDTLNPPIRSILNDMDRRTLNMAERKAGNRTMTASKDYGYVNTVSPEGEKWLFPKKGGK